MSSAMKSAVIGNEDFSMSDAMTSEYDLQFASKNFKFGLIPKVHYHPVCVLVGNDDVVGGRCRQS